MYIIIIPRIYGKIFIQRINKTGNYKNSCNSNNGCIRQTIIITQVTIIETTESKLIKLNYLSQYIFINLNNIKNINYYKP